VNRLRRSVTPGMGAADRRLFSERVK